MMMLFKRHGKKNLDPVPCSYLRKPSFKWREDIFLKEKENFLSGLWRSLRIFFEYMRGFYVFRDVGDCITVFGSARFDPSHVYYQIARKLGKKLAEAGFTVMTGGGPGIMEAANRGAKEAGGLSISCNIELPKSKLEPPNPYIDRKIKMHYFFVRKVMLTKYSIAFIVLPGGFGTLDELFEMATLIQTSKMPNFPLVLMGVDYWRPLISYLDQTLLKLGTINSEDVCSLYVTDSPDEALSYVLRRLDVMLHHK